MCGYYRQAHGDEDTVRIVFNPKSKEYIVDPQYLDDTEHWTKETLGLSNKDNWWG